MSFQVLRTTRLKQIIWDFSCAARRLTSMLQCVCLAVANSFHG